MAGIMEQARTLGNALARTEEYQAVRRARKDADDDREIVELVGILQRLEGTIAAELRAGKDPEKEVAEEYEATVARLQANPTYQRLVAAQANFDKVLRKVDGAIQEGVAEGAESRIILAP